MSQYIHGHTFPEPFTTRTDTQRSCPTSICPTCNDAGRQFVHIYWRIFLRGKEITFTHHCLHIIYTSSDTHYHSHLHAFHTLTVNIPGNVQAQTLGFMGCRRYHGLVCSSWKRKETTFRFHQSSEKKLHVYGKCQECLTMCCSFLFHFLSLPHPSCCQGNGDVFIIRSSLFVCLYIITPLTAHDISPHKQT